MSERDDFLRWFADEFQKELAGVQVPALPDASWDRKAAWLLWRERRKAKPEPLPTGGLFD